MTDTRTPQITFYARTDTKGLAVVEARCQDARHSVARKLPEPLTVHTFLRSADYTEMCAECVHQLRLRADRVVEACRAYDRGEGSP